VHLVCSVCCDADDFNATIVQASRIMSDLTKRGITAALTNVPKGVAFEIADLILVKGWADFHNFRMVVRLDHGAAGEEYEEVIAFHTGMDSPCQFIVWRSPKAVFVQPLLGRKRRFGSVAAALGSLALSRHHIQ
jgi:hypothetical protein